MTSSRPEERHYRENGAGARAVYPRSTPKGRVGVQGHADRWKQRASSTANSAARRICAFPASNDRTLSGVIRRRKLQEGREASSRVTADRAVAFTYPASLTRNAVGEAARDGVSFDPGRTARKIVMSVPPEAKVKREDGEGKEVGFARSRGITAAAGSGARPVAVWKRGSTR
jgi:hypothetical protein